MKTNCLNCGAAYEGHYCSNCGQKATTGRLTAAVLIHDVLHFFTHIESGFLYTTWSFLIRPGGAALEFIAGKRKRHQRPVSFFLIWTGLYILIHNMIVNYGHYQLTTELVAQMDITEQSNLVFRQHFSFFVLPVLFLSAYLIYLILGRPKFNFTEILTASLYGIGTYFMMSMVGDILLGFILGVNILLEEVFVWQAALSITYNFWFSYDVFRRVPIRFLWPRLILTALLVATVGWVIMFYLPMVWIYLTS